MHPRGARTDAGADATTGRADPNAGSNTDAEAHVRKPMPRTDAGARVKLQLPRFACWSPPRPIHTAVTTPFRLLPGDSRIGLLNMNDLDVRDRHVGPETRFGVEEDLCCLLSIVCVDAGVSAKPGGPGHIVGR